MIMVKEQNRMLGYLLAPLLGGGAGVVLAAAAQLPWPAVLLFGIAGAAVARALVRRWLSGLHAELDTLRQGRLDAALAELRAQPYEWWAARVGTAPVELAGDAPCPVCVQAYWNGKAGGSVRVVVSAGNQTVAAPVVGGFIVAPDGSLTAES